MRINERAIDSEPYQKLEAENNTVELVDEPVIITPQTMEHIQRFFTEPMQPYYGSIEEDRRERFALLSCYREVREGKVHWIIDNMYGIIYKDVNGLLRVNRSDTNVSLSPQKQGHYADYLDVLQGLHPERDYFYTSIHSHPGFSSVGPSKYDEFFMGSLFKGVPSLILDPVNKNINICFPKANSLGAPITPGSKLYLPEGYDYRYTSEYYFTELKNRKSVLSPEDNIRRKTRVNFTDLEAEKNKPRLKVSNPRNATENKSNLGLQLTENLRRKSESLASAKKDGNELSSELRNRLSRRSISSNAGENLTRKLREKFGNTSNSPRVKIGERVVNPSNSTNAQVSNGRIQLGSSKENVKNLRTLNTHRTTPKEPRVKVYSQNTRRFAFNPRGVYQKRFEGAKTSNEIVEIANNLNLDPIKLRQALMKFLNQQEEQ